MSNFLNTDELKISRLQAGQVVTTRGYYEPNDLGGATYHIMTVDEFDAPINEKSDFLLPNGNVAALDKSDRVMVRCFGAKGDGVNDDTDNVQAFADNGGSLYLTRGAYKITGPISLKPNTYIIGEGQGVGTVGSATESQEIALGASIIKCDENFTGNTAFIFKTEDFSAIFSVGIDKVKFSMNGSDATCVEIYKGYDSVSLSNINFMNVGDNSSALRMQGNPEDTSNEISQTILLQNIVGIHLNNTATSPTFYFNQCQEMTLIGVKAFAGYQAAKPSCYGMEFEDCRGVSLLGCSVAHSLLAGINIKSTTRAVDGISIEGHTFENCDAGGVRVRGSASPNNVARVYITNPRYQFPQAIAFDIDGADACQIDATSRLGTVGVNCNQNIITVQRQDFITDDGLDTQIDSVSNLVDGERTTSQGYESLEYFVAPTNYSRSESSPSYQYLAGSELQHTYRQSLDANDISNLGFSFRHIESGAIMEHQTDGDLRLVGDSNNKDAGLILDDSSSSAWKIKVGTEGALIIRNETTGAIAGVSGTYQLSSLTSITLVNGIITQLS